MNFLSDAALFAIVLAVNLFLLGALLAGGLALSFRFIENVSPRFRYFVSIAVFLMAVLLPLAATLKIPSERIISLNSMSEAGQETALSHSAGQRENSVRVEADLPENSSGGFLNNLITAAAGSLIGNIFSGIWILGSGCLLSGEVVGAWRLKKLRNLWRTATDSEKSDLYCPHNVRLYYDKQQSPGTVGLLYPAIVLPEEFPAGLPIESKRFIMGHELAHVRGRDPLVGFILRVIKAFSWISPALWMIEHLITLEREAAADRAAINFLSKESTFETDALNYADTLLTIAKTLNSLKDQNRRSQIVGIGTGSELEIRVRRLLASSQTTRLQVASAITACLLTLAVVLFIPLAAFSSLNKAVPNETFDTAINSLSYPIKENNEDITRSDYFNTASKTALFTENGKVTMSSPLVKRTQNENLPPVENLSASKSQQLTAKSEDAEFPVKTISDRNPATAEVRKARPNNSKAENLESMSSLESSTDELKTLESQPPANDFKTGLQSTKEPMRRRDSGLIDNHQNELPKLPVLAVAPTLKPYISKYIPYTAH